MSLYKHEKKVVSENQEPETAIYLASDYRMKHVNTVKPCRESNRGLTTSSYGHTETVHMHRCSWQYRFMEHSSSCSLLNDIRKLKSRAFLLYGTQAEGIVFRPQANISKIQEKRTYGSHGVDNRHPSMIYNCLHAHKIMIIIANKVKESLIIGA